LALKIKSNKSSRSARLFYLSQNDGILASENQPLTFLLFLFFVFKTKKKKKNKYMNVIKTKIDGLVIIEPKLFVDERGYFFESFNQRDFTSAVGNVTFVQDNESKSSYGVLRGLHFQLPPYSQSKLVRVIEGKCLM
jgi:hypothetical protein